MKNVADIAVEVEKLVQKQDVRTRFFNHIDQFYAMAESYGKALQSYSNKLTKTKAQIEQYSPEQIQEYKDQRPDSPGINLYDVCPPPEGWKQTNNICCNYYFELSEPLMTYHPGEPVNPILWLGTSGDSIVQREPTDAEKLTCDYILLAIAHDHESTKPTDTKIFQPEYKGKWFKRDTFFNPDAMKPTIWTKYFENLYNVSLLNRALGRVSDDIESCRKQDEDSGKPPIGQTDRKILNILRSLDETEALTSEAIADRLTDLPGDECIILDASTIRKNHLKQLEPYGLTKTEHGYCIR